MESMNKFKAKAMQETERMIVASEESLAKYNEGYKEGYSDGYDKALENVQGIIRKYNLGGGKELKPATKFIHCTLTEQLAKIHSEYIEVISAVIHNENKRRIAEELADVQEACETAMAILGLGESERQMIRKRVLCKNASRGYYGGMKDERETNTQDRL